MSNEQQSYLDEQKKKIILEWLDKNGLLSKESVKFAMLQLGHYQRI